jgi:hypothetical protein
VVTVADGRSRVLRPRGPGYVFSSGATAVLLLLGLVALNASQPAPPTVAEFAPAALDQIKDAPDRQSSDVGDAPGAVTASSSPTPTARPTPPGPSPTPSGPPVNRQFHCVGNPPRQIEDPQSPPCVPGWQGDNGGATAPGVTRDEIRVVAPYGTFLTGDPTPQWQAMVKFFNSRFEFYGRKIILKPLYATGDNFAYPVPADMQKDATKAADEYKAFASLGYPDRKGAEHTYYDTLADKKVISVIGRETAKGTEAYFRKRAPYQWNRGAAIDTQMKNYGQFLCREWVGRPLHYGGPAWPFTPAPSARKFGVLVTETTDHTVPDVKPLTDILKACNAPPFVVTAPETQSQQDGVNPMLGMIQAKVTSIVCVCDVGSARDFLNGAEAQSYRPEWLMGSYVNGDVDNSFSTSPPTQTVNVFGTSFLDKFLPIQQAFWFRAMHEGDPSVPTPTNAGPIATYQDLLLLASGIQMAGPHLTPQTFADALHRTVFPNPDANGPPYYQGRVGFEGGTYSMRMTASTFWYDQSTGGVDDPSTPGRVCHVRHGVRYEYGDWPKEDPPYKQTSCT